MTDRYTIPRYEFLRLTHDNWEEFEFPMQQLLVRQGLWKYVKNPWPNKDDKDAYSAWEEGCEKARSEIALRVSAEVMHIVRASEDPAAIWKSFRTTLGSKGWTKRLALRRQLFYTGRQNTQSMRSWANGIRELARKITDLGGTVSDDDLIVVLTNKLPDSYQPLIVSLELVNEAERTVDYIVSRLINEEDRQGKEVNEESLALSARKTKPKTPKSQITCWTCHQKGHYSSDCPGAGNKGGDKTPSTAASQSGRSGTSGTLFWGYKGFSLVTRTWGCVGILLFSSY